MVNPLYHPLILCLANILVSTATAAYTQKGSPLRYAAFIVSTAISWLTLSYFHDYIQTTGLSSDNGLLGMTILVLLRLQRRKGRNSLGGNLAPKYVLLRAALDQRRRLQMFRISLSIICDMFLHDLASCYVISAWLLGCTISIPLLLTYRITNVSIEEIVTRIRIPVTYWVAQYCFIQGVCSLFTAINVFLKPSELKFWRPMFGSIITSYTIRGFWGKFWHQNIQLHLKGPAEYIMHTILCIPPGTIFARYTKILLAFAVSGMFHVIADSGGVVPMSQSGALRFFCTQALGIVLEDGIQELYRKGFGSQKSRFGEAIEYLWVLAFICWSTPVWVYPVARTMKREDMLLTLDAFRPLISKLW